MRYLYPWSVLLLGLRRLGQLQQRGLRVTVPTFVVQP